jgi:hypothetical protein
MGPSNFGVIWETARRWTDLKWCASAI